MKIMYVVCAIFSDRQQFLSDRQQFFTDRHPHDNHACLCFTLRHHDSEWKRFSPRGIAWFSTFSRYLVHGRMAEPSLSPYRGPFFHVKTDPPVWF